MTCCCIDQPKYFNFGQRKIRRRIVYIVTVILSLCIVGLIVGLIMKAAIVGDSYNQGDSFSKVQVTSCAYVDVVFNASDFRVDAVPGTGCEHINKNWFDTLVVQNTAEGVCCHAVVHVPGAGKVSKFLASSSGSGAAWSPPGGDFAVDVDSGSGFAFVEGGEINTLSGSVSSGSTVWVSDSVSVASFQVKESSGGRLVHGA
jgi:hypothetical protein